MRSLLLVLLVTSCSLYEGDSTSPRRYPDAGVHANPSDGGSCHNHDGGYDPYDAAYWDGGPYYPDAEYDPDGGIVVIEDAGQIQYDVGHYGPIDGH